MRAQLDAYEHAVSGLVADEMHQRAQRVIRQAEYLSSRCHVVVANPLHGQREYGQPSRLLCCQPIPTKQVRPSSPCLSSGQDERGSGHGRRDRDGRELLMPNGHRGRAGSVVHRVHGRTGRDHAAPPMRSSRPGTDPCVANASNPSFKVHASGRKMPVVGRHGQDPQTARFPGPGLTAPPAACNWSWPQGPAVAASQGAIRRGPPTQQPPSHNKRDQGPRASPAIRPLHHADIAIAGPECSSTREGLANGSRRRGANTHPCLHAGTDCAAANAVDSRTTSSGWKTTS